MTVTTVAALVAELGVIAGVVIPVVISVRKIADGTRCQLRSEMLRIYYHNRESEKIRQYELENFIMLYGAYTALHGNSFITKIYSEVMTWEVIS